MVNKDYQNKISSFWQKWQKRKQNYKDPAIWWGNGKKFTQGLTKDFLTELKETEKKKQTKKQKTKNNIYTNYNWNYKRFIYKKIKIKSKLIT